MKILIIILCFFFFLTCEKEVSPQNDSEKTETNQESKTSRITKKEIESILFLDYGLSRPAKKTVANWKSYAKLESLVSQIKNADLSYFEGDEKIMTVFIQDLKSSIPKNISTQSIIARIAALETKFLKLKSAIRINTTSKAELASAIKEFFQASSNLHLQINKKLEKDAQDISKFSI